MKRYLFVLIIITGLSDLLSAQSNLNVGAGYFGHTLSHPGIVLQMELENNYSQKASLPLRVNLGYYHHPRNHNGIFLDINTGFRRYFRSGLVLEESIGIGILQTMLNGEDGVFKVDENGVVSEASKFNRPDLMPSVSLGLGYNLTKRQSAQTILWLRPKLFWQYPQKSSSVYHIALEFGVTYKIKSIQ